MEVVDLRHFGVRPTAAEARDYIDYLEKMTGVEVGCISTGPERNQTIIRKGSRFEQLLG